MRLPEIMLDKDIEIIENYMDGEAEIRCLDLMNEAMDMIAGAIENFKRIDAIMDYYDREYDVYDACCQEDVEFEDFWEILRKMEKIAE